MAEKVCGWCDAPFNPPSYRHKYCSAECKRKSRNFESSERRRSYCVVSFAPCAVCSKTFVRNRSRVTCSDQCSAARLKQKSLAWAASNPEKAAERTRKWRGDNIERARFLSRANYASDLDRHRGYYRAWRDRNIEEQRTRERSTKRCHAVDRALGNLIIEKATHNV